MSCIQKKQEKQDGVSDSKFITTYNPALPNTNEIIQNNLFILHINDGMKKSFLSYYTLKKRKESQRKFVSFLISTYI